MSIHADALNHGTAKKSVTFFNVRPSAVRELLVRTFEGAVTLKPGEELDCFQVGYELSDEEALHWLQMLLCGYKPTFTRDYHGDGTVTLYPNLI